MIIRWIIKHILRLELTTEAILKEVAKKHEISIKDMLGPRKIHRYVRARREAMRRLRKEKKMSLVEIAQIMKKDHKTVLTGIKKG